jgi:GT2 family glycosyltransferase
MTTADLFVDIVIPTWNGWPLLERCLQTIARQSFCNSIITVVDNGSTDGTAASLEKLYPEVRSIVFAENRGFSAAVNAGITGGASPYIFLLNNDTELEPDCLQQLVTAAGSLPDFAFFVPKMLSFHDRALLDGAGDGYLRGGAGYRLGTMEQDNGAYDQSGPVFGACAGAVLYRRSLFEKVGLFDEDFFAYLEDVDLNLRINRRGLRGYYVAPARVYHVGSATTGSKINPMTIRLSTRNSLYVLVKNYQLSLFLRFLPVIVVYQFCWLLFAVKKQQFRPYCRGMWQAVARLRQMRRKHHELRGHDTLTSPEFASCLQRAEKSVVESIMRRRREQGKGNWLLRLYGFLFL